MKLNVYAARESKEEPEVGSVVRYCGGYFLVCFDDIRGEKMLVSFLRGSVVYGFEPGDCFPVDAEVTVVEKG